MTNHMRCRLYEVCCRLYGSGLIVGQVAEYGIFASRGLWSRRSSQMACQRDLTRPYAMHDTRCYAGTGMGAVALLHNGAGWMAGDGGGLLVLASLI